MGKFLGGVFSNDSLFGQLMTRCGILVAANLMFIVCSIPVVTAGPSLCALYHVMLAVLRGRWYLNPFKEFWKGFRSNFRQALISHLIFMAIAVLGYLDYRFLRHLTTGGAAGAGPAAIMKYGVLTVLIAAFIIMIFLYPVMAAFADTLPHLMRNAVYFAVKNPLRLIASASLYLIPAAVTFLHVYLQPLYAFCWFFFGFSAIVMAHSSLLIRDFEKHLSTTPSSDDETQEDTDSGENHSGSGKKTLGEMKKLGM